MPITRRRVTNAEDMKALAHPVRMDVLDLLVVNGPLTASDAAVRLQQTPANVSWHLRKLAEHGFVRQATKGAGRKRPWKIVAESLSWGEDAEDAAVAEAMQDVFFERELQRLRAALASRQQETEDWRDATSVNQSRLWLTASEAKLLGEEIAELFASRAERGLDPGQRPKDSRVMALMAWIVPAGPPEQSPTST